MADLNRLYDALRNADAAGDTEAAKKLADYIRTVQAAPVSAESQKPPQQETEDPNHAGAAQGQRIKKLASQYIDEAMKNPIRSAATSYLDNLTSAGEAALNMGTGIASSAVGGLAGLGSLVKSGIENQINKGLHIPTQDEVDSASAKAAQLSGGIQQAGTYQPRTTGGKIVTELASVPLNAASQGARSIGGDIGQFVGGDKGRIAGEEIGGAAPAIAATIAGGASLLKRGAAPIADDVPARRAFGDIDMIRNANTEAPQNAVTNRYDASGQRIIPPEPVPDHVPPTPESAQPIYNIVKQTEGGNLPLNEQMARAKTLQRIGLDSARDSAIMGDAFEGAAQAQMARFTQEPAGQAAAELFNAERSALQNHAKSIISDTGGSEGMDASTLNSRGQVIAAPFDSLRQYFDDEVKKLYAQADEASGSVAETNLSKLEDFLSTKSNFAGKAENSSLGKGLSHYLREQGIMDADGSLLPVTAKQAEGIKQYINGQWSPGTSGLAGKIKGIIDDDVFKSAGGDIYAQARNLYKMQKAALDNPSGIAKILDYDPQTPINRATPFEKIPDTLTNLPVAQFGHVIDVLNKVLDPQYNTPELLQLQAHDALNEIKAHMANSLHETGSKFQTKWNAPGVTQYLKNNAPKFQMVFDDPTLRKITDLNDAGHILSVDKSYPGAAAQASIAIKRGLLPQIAGRGLAGLGGLAGSIAGPIGTTAGATVGSAAGESLAAAMNGKAALKRFNGGIRNLNEFTAPKLINPEPELAAPTTPKINAPLAAALATSSMSNELQHTISKLSDPTPIQDIIDSTILSIEGGGILGQARNKKQY